MYRWALAVVLLSCGLNASIVNAQESPSSERPTRLSANPASESTLWTNSACFVPSRLLNYEFQSITFGYERLLGRGFSAEGIAGLPISPQAYRGQSNRLSGYELGAAVRYYFVKDDPEVQPYLRFGGEWTENNVTFTGYERQAGENFARRNRITAARRRQEVNLGIGLKLITAGNFYMDGSLLVALGRIGLFSTNGREFEVRDQDAIFNNSFFSETNAYERLLLIRFRVSIGFVF